MDGFHDYRIGTLEYKGDKARITIEDVIPGVHISKNAGLIWDISFEGVTDFQINTDCVLGFSLYEVEIGDKLGQIAFNMDQGYIEITAEKVALGIPSKIEK